MFCANPQVLKVQHGCGQCTPAGRLAVLVGCPPITKCMVLSMLCLMQSCSTVCPDPRFDLSLSEQPFLFSQAPASVQRVRSCRGFPARLARILWVPLLSFRFVILVCRPASVRVIPCPVPICTVAGCSGIAGLRLPLSCHLCNSFAVHLSRNVARSTLDTKRLTTDQLTGQ